MKGACKWIKRFNELVEMATRDQMKHPKFVVNMMKMNNKQLLRSREEKEREQ